MHDKAVDIHPSVIEFTPECFKIQEMCDKVVENFLPRLEFVPDWFVTKND